MGTLLYAVLAGLCLPLISRCEKAANKYVTVTLSTKWHETPLVQEVGEFLADESDQFFWQYCDQLAAADSTRISGYSDKDLYDYLLKIVGEYLSPSRLDLLKFALAMRVYSPRVEMFKQIAITTLDESRTCKVAVDVNGYVTCSEDELVTALDALSTDPIGDDSMFDYSIDHHYPSSRHAPNKVVLYADIGSEEFEKFHKILKPLAQKRKIDYMLRHHGMIEYSTPVRLSGYGVELAIKSTEYKAQDDTKVKANISGGAIVEEEETEIDLNGFNFKLLKELHPELKGSLGEFKVHLLDADELTPLKVWELQDLSFQAGQRVLAAPLNEALQVLQDLSQNFPIYARSLTKTVVKKDYRREVDRNSAQFEDIGVSPGDSALFINGLLIDLDSTDLYQLLTMLKQEEVMMSAFFRMGFRREYLSVLTALDFSQESTTYAVDFRQGFPEFINNLDKDVQYREWGNSVKMMLQPYFPGMLRPIGRNFFNLIFVLDPAHRDSRALLKIAYSFWAHEIPFRIGFMFVADADKAVTGKDDPSVALVNVYNWVKTDRSPPKALKFICDLFDEIGEREVKSEDVIKLFKKRFRDEDPDMVFGADSDYDRGRNNGRNFLEKTGLGQAPKVLLNGIPLEDSGITADRFEETVINEVMKITPKIQRDVMQGKLDDSMNIMDYLLNRPEVMPRLNQKILSDKDQKYVDMSDVFEYNPKNIHEFKQLQSRQKTCYVTKTLKYLAKNEDPVTRPVTMWVVADVETSQGRNVVLSALRHLKSTNKVRLALIHNPTDGNEAKAAKLVVTKMVEVAVKALPNFFAKAFIIKLVKDENYDSIATKKTTIDELAIHEMNTDGYKKELSLASDDFLAFNSMYAQRVLELLPGQSAVVVNGRVIALERNESFSEEDFNLMEKQQLSTNAQLIAEQVEKWELGHEEDRTNNLVMRTSALVMKNPVRKKRHWVILADDKHSTVTIPASDDSTAPFDIIAIVDPLSRDAQKIAPLLTLLLKVVNADLKIVLNPKPKLSEMPLKNFYRLVVEPELKFGVDGKRRSGPYARFHNLPQKQLLTLNMIPPEAWLVESVRAVYDLDNIKLEDVPNEILAEYELEYLLLEGHCFDEITGNPPRGLQFDLGTSREPVMQGTIVMANLGYFQLKASPGAWQLKLRDGRSKDIYDIASHDNTESPPHLENVTVVVDSFTGKTIRLRVVKKPEKLNDHLLVDPKDTEEKSLWESLSRIMMLSVVKNTKSPVKFWFLKNYLSPYFKDFLPSYAKRYGFEYELVQYKWPRWLHQQTEKQRIIWGYKILFLDVLFPLDVKKIIFVDADQVVRVDMKDLMNFDLEGAPYGYVPFCDSRTEMDGFRFWKDGYWASHLGHRKYHISALYVVDLKKFRQIAAGDRLRGQYQGLSADPNSLANLDQDLPNNMIHQVKIKSLPQEWLWCETWCSDGTKSKAKTIDLCNNPQTKEPKLSAAMRIISEWKDYDSEIRNVQEQFLSDFSPGEQVRQKEAAKVAQEAGAAPSVDTDDSQDVEPSKTGSHEQHTDL